MPSFVVITPWIHLEEGRICCSLIRLFPCVVILQSRNLLYTGQVSNALNIDITTKFPITTTSSDMLKDFC